MTEDQLRKKLVQILVNGDSEELYVDTKAKFLVDDLVPFIHSAEAEIEKAYGGCHLCYGKGYHTKRVGTSSRYGNVTHDTIGYCTCNRGKQLEQVVAESYRRGQIDELKHMPHQYDLGCLLRKLPTITKQNHSIYPRLQQITKNEWQIGYSRHRIYAVADTPEDAAAKLCIQLIKEGKVQV